MGGGAWEWVRRVKQSGGEVRLRLRKWVKVGVPVRGGEGEGRGEWKVGGGEGVGGNEGNGEGESEGWRRGQGVKVRACGAPARWPPTNSGLLTMAHQRDGDNHRQGEVAARVLHLRGQCAHLVRVGVGVRVRVRARARARARAAARARARA